MTLDQIEELFRTQQSRDKRGLIIHLVLGLLACICVFVPTTGAELGLIPIGICFIIRMTGQHPILEPLAFDRLIWLILAWSGWLAISSMWSAGGGRAWIHDVQSLRFLLVLLFFWPIMQYRGLMVLALCIGGALGQCVQGVHLLSVQFGWGLFDRFDDRISGWWDPVVGGSLLCVLLGLHMGAMLWTSAPRVRLIAGLGVAAALGGIVLTGTRGAYIGAALLVPTAIAARVIFAERGGVRPWRLLASLLAAALLAAILAGAVAWAVAGDRIGARVDRGVQEVRAAMQSQNYDSDTGMRLAMWRWAIAAIREHPLIGVGAGGYQPWVRAQSPERAEALGAPLAAAAKVHAHAHSWYLHSAAITGLIGLGLLVTMLGYAVISGLRERRVPESEHDRYRATLAGAYTAGPALGLLGLCTAGIFDSISVNQQTAVVLCVLLVLVLPSRPRPAGVRQRPDAGAGTGER